MVAHLHWGTGLASQAWVRFSVSPGGGGLHDHDFPEWFWVESGLMRHECDGVVADLSVGDLVLLHPRHRHRIAALDATGSHVVCSVEPRLFARIAARLRPQLAEWPWPTSGQPPARRRLGPLALQRLRNLVDLLPLREQTPADAELLVAGTLRVLADATAEPAADAPAWLAAAVAGLDDPGLAVLGVGAFIARCGRASATVCRACRRHYGLRPNELVERARLDHAARRLRCTTEAIPAIAERAGYASLSHFYRAFRRRYDCAPGAFRAQA